MSLIANLLAHIVADRVMVNGNALIRPLCSAELLRTRLILLSVFDNFPSGGRLVKMTSGK